MLGRLLCKRLPARFRQWEIPERDRMQKKVRRQAMPSPLPWWLLEQQLLLLHGSCFSGRIHCDSSFLGGPCSRLWCPISLLCLSSTRRGGHTLKLLTSRSPHLSRLALSVPLTPLVLGHLLLFPRLLLQILSLLPSMCSHLYYLYWIKRTLQT